MNRRIARIDRQVALQVDYIPREHVDSQPAPNPEQANAFRSRKQQVLDAIIERMRAEKYAMVYEEQKDNRAAARPKLRDYA